jgi:hypothetical protein
MLSILVRFDLVQYQMRCQYEKQASQNETSFDKMLGRRIQAFAQMSSMRSSIMIAGHSLKAWDPPLSKTARTLVAGGV